MARLAEFRIFNRVITEDEVSHGGSVARDCGGCVQGWRSTLAVRKARAEALLPDVSRRRLPGAACGVRTREREHREIELRSNTAMVMEERPDSKAAAHLLFRGMYDQPRELLEARTPVVPAADGAGSAAEPPRAGALDSRSIRTRCSRASPSTGSGRSFSAPDSSSRPTTSARRPSRRRILNCSTGWPSNSASPVGT